ncbi:MAG: aspartyl-phosphate phosphatase Spo0E family protein [Hydrogenibacillus sp.]|nr:aspartyl-phosphate phosphatase Spo0E family protein [Hydrogenibacillus sp.]
MQIVEAHSSGDSEADARLLEEIDRVRREIERHSEAGMQLAEPEIVALSQKLDQLLNRLMQPARRPGA